MTTSGNLLQNYFSRLYIPRITWTDIIEIIIIAVVLYNILLWIMNTKAWALLKGIIVGGSFGMKEKLKMIAKLLIMCDESKDIIDIEDYEIPDVKVKAAAGTKKKINYFN